MFKGSLLNLHVSVLFVLEMAKTLIFQARLGSAREGSGSARLGSARLGKFLKNKLEFFTPKNF